MTTTGEHAAVRPTTPVVPPAPGPVTPPRERAGPSAASDLQARLARWLPSGDTLDDESFDRRHQVLCWVLGIHVPLLVAFGLSQGYDLAVAASEAAIPAGCLLAARLTSGRRVPSWLVAAGLVAASTALVYLSGGTVEARFHIFVVVGLVALYHDAATLAWTVGATAVAYLLSIALDADAVFDHPAAQDKPLVWAAIHVLALAAACVPVLMAWRATDSERRRAASRAGEAARAEATVAKADAAQHQTVSHLLVHLARRNQALLDRQLELIAELEQHEATPEALSDLFRLDHLATRIRRNAESLLVLSGEDPPRRWGRPVPLGEVVRAAAAEVEDYERVEALVNDQIDVTGRAVADMAHLLAELIENATTYSPPGAEVRVRTHLSSANHAACLLSIEDTGPGMTPEALAAANRLLADPPPLDLTRGTLGFQVVARLARRYKLQVQLTATPGGGLTALVTLPDELVTDRLAPVGALAGTDGIPDPTVVPGPGLNEWRLPDADTLGRMVAPTPPSARRSGEVGRVLRGMAIPRIGAEEVPPGTPGPPPPPPPGPAGPPAPPVPPGPPDPEASVAAPPPPGPAPHVSGEMRAVPGPARAGLTQRVPGEGLRALAGDDEIVPAPPRPPRTEPRFDLDRMKSMLSKFQANRGTADGPPPTGSPPDEVP